MKSIYIFYEKVKKIEVKKKIIIFALQHYGKQV